jgi:hypothetical protein
MQHCHSFQVPFLHLAISACVSPHEYGLHPTLAGSPHASSRIAFVSYGLSFPLPLLPTPPRGDAVTVGYKPERSIWRELSSDALEEIQRMVHIGNDTDLMPRVLDLANDSHHGSDRLDDIVF